MCDDQLTDVFNLDINDIIIGDVQERDIPNSDPAAKKLKYRTITITVKYGGGKTGKLIISTMRDMFSFGVQENKDPNTSQVTGYSMPICLVGRQEDTEEQSETRKNERLWVQKVKELFDYIAEQVVEKKKQLKMFNLTKEQIKNPIYEKLDEDGNPAEGSSPMLYPKIMQTKKTGKITTLFEDSDGNPIDMSNLMGTYCKGEMAILIQSIYCGGGKVTIQVKLYHAIATPISTGPKRILPRKPRSANIDISRASNPLFEEEDEDTPTQPDNEGSIEDEAVEKPKKKVTKKVTRKKTTE